MTYTQVARIAKQVYNKEEKVTVEVKRFRVYSNSINLTSAGTLFSLGSITAGTASNNRIGRQITLKSLLLRYSITQNGATNQNRIIIFRWNSDSQPTVPDVLPFDSAIYWLEPINEDTLEDIQVLYDKMVVTGVSGTAAPVYTDKVYLKLGGKCKFTTAGPDNGSVWMYIASDQSVANFPYMQYYSRLSFTDE